MENKCVNQREIIECLRLVVLQEEDVVEKLKEYEKRIGLKIYTTPLIFSVPMNAKPDKYNKILRICGVDHYNLWWPLCDCWFEHVYLDYIQNGKCNEEMFSRICSNLENGHCEHFTKGRRFHVRVYLIHAAVATNNKKLTKYICRKMLKKSITLSTGIRSLTAAHIAVLKGSADALKYIIDLNPVKNMSDIDFKYALFDTMDYAFFDTLDNIPSCTENTEVDVLENVRYHVKYRSIAKRNDFTGNIETFELRGCGVLAYLLAHCKNPSQKTILIQFLQIFKEKDIEDLIQEFLSSRDEEFALIVLRDKRTSNMRLNSTILLNAVFLHAHDFVYFWIRQKRNLSVEVMGVKIHALFIAEALGCQECISLMRRGKQKEHTINADVSLGIIACYSAEKFKYDSSTLINILKTLCNTGFCKLNKRNSLFDTILHVLIKSEFLTKEAMECLLELGCDVNAPNGEGKTPLHYLKRVSWNGIDTVKCLLEHGADVNSTDLQGRTPFMEIIDSSEKITCFGPTPFGRPVECLKNIIYFNPRVDIHSNVLNILVQKRHFYCCLDGCINLPLVPSNMHVSFFAILMEMGFMNYKPGERNVPSGTLRKRKSYYDDYYYQFVSQPRSLQSICRVEIRKNFPGYQLHKVFRQYQIPKRIKKYIFFDDILFPE